jgi:hypothetical protein
MNEPTQVDLLDKNQVFIRNCSFTSSQPGSLNDLGSESTRYVRIIGPAGSAVTVYDDQKFRRDENFQSIQKTTDADLIVPVAVQLLPGEQKDGVYSGTGAGYTWALYKVIKTDWWQSTAILDTVAAVVGAVAAVIEANPGAFLPAYGVTSGVLGAVLNSSSQTSADNCTDNISSLAFGFPLPPAQ